MVDKDGKIKAVEHIDFGPVVQRKPNAIKHIVQRIKALTAKS